jgi:hypothetical protein
MVASVALAASGDVLPKQRNCGAGGELLADEV